MQIADEDWLAGILRDALAPDPELTVSEWADRHRVLGLRASSEAGPWRTARTPYLREIMDALSPSHPAQKVVLMKGAQVGGTECGNNWIGYVIHHAPGPFLAVQPTTELAKRFSRQRIDPLIDETAALRERVAPARSRDAGNRQLEKEFPGGTLVMTGANSAVGLRSMPARYLFLDEVDAYPPSADDEGDPVALAIARTRTFAWRRKILIVSTPTVAGRSRIEREFLLTDRRRHHVPCPHCGHRQALRFEQLRWERGAPESAAYLCETCERPIEERHKDALLAAGTWVPEAVSADPRAVGFHLSALYSPYGWLSWAEIARQWEEAQGSIEAIRAFRNTVLGETWQERGDAPDWQRLIERREPYPLGIVPEGAVVLTAGVDVQDDRIECDVWAWARGFTSWLVDHVVLAGNPRDAEVWDHLADVLERDWPDEHDRHRRIALACVDTGGRDTTAVYRHLVRLRRPAVIAPTKGVDGWNRTDPVRGPTKVFNGLLRLWTVATATWKAELYRRLWLARDGDGFPDGWVHLPAGIDAEWVRQLVAEELRTVRDKRGYARQEWAKLRERNEALDCAVLARAALWLLGADARGHRFWDAHEARLASAADRPADAPTPPPPAERAQPQAARPFRRVIPSLWMS
ncbi:phage terminase large subunit family protein [Elioraea sp.]|uniref:phage terminase large subunit family protein n=1 Tax=Elioraea sp. TaxID=2185103 RepID=UPI0021DC1DBB|nr:phage terminase large subunit family protein [Elioraea sp.]GIX10363.1 MAG: terminase [Elioraea sp.]